MKKAAREMTEELKNKIERYNETQDEKLRLEIINNSFYGEYKSSEANINYIILEINDKLKEISKKGTCSK